MMYGIIGALDEEVELLEAALEHKSEQQVGPYRYVQGTLDSKQVVICRCGVGKVAAGSCAAAMLALYPLTGLINTGAAGGIAQGMQVGDLALSLQAVQHDVNATVFGYQLGQVPGHEPTFVADEKLLQAARSAAAKTGFKPPFEGTILSGDQFVSSDAVVADLTGKFPHSVAVEMEGAAIAQIASDFKVPFLIVRAISDCADNHGAVSYETFSREISHKSANFVRALLNAI